jgi:hypothetical protein
VPPLRITSRCDIGLAVAVEPVAVCKEARMNERMKEHPGEEDEEPVVDLITFMQSSPLAKAIDEDGIEFEIDRADDFMRDIDFGDSDEPS